MPILRSFASRVEADLAASYLRAQGFDVRAVNDDAGGLHPQLAYGSGGNRLAVPDEQMDEARALLDAVDAGGEQPTFVLVHGAWHGSWAWSEVAELLDRAGRAWVGVQLPSSGGDPGSLGGFDDDVATVRAAVADVRGPVVLVGHSYGGVVITQAADASSVVHLVYVAALLLDVGGSLAGSDDRHLPAWVEFSDDERACRPTAPRQVFYGDLDAVHADAAGAMLSWQSTRALRGRVSRTAWREIPTTYVVCDLDAAIPAAAQEKMAAHADDVVHLSSAHSPFLSRPGELVAVLLALPAA